MIRIISAALMPRKIPGRSAVDTAAAPEKPGSLSSSAPETKYTPIYLPKLSALELSQLFTIPKRP